MFKFFIRPYVPGFRVRPQEDVPGFNIDENDAAQTQTPPAMTSFTLDPDGFARSPTPLASPLLRNRPRRRAQSGASRPGLLHHRT